MKPEWLPAKVGYRTAAGGASTAYLDAGDPMTHIFTGTNKYTDENVAVIWDDDASGWVEVTH
ncbi:hypothetical protein IT072_02505 [Leifsonia sp. ZF2019]|uniref:hypothetical protein n=1 Tax=Leifsonia sp. ZF2019 TaxID=2781978 RepID=UPI001CBAD01F|nr:hypothetical protein [Leifsonia sp. ZF2019]UAJ79969.1 hypothetical protein IT072_02505 [Leifsonia sp. ZF2019]